MKNSFFAFLILLISIFPAHAFEEVWEGSNIVYSDGSGVSWRPNVGCDFNILDDRITFSGPNPESSFRVRLIAHTVSANRDIGLPNATGAVVIHTGTFSLTPEDANSVWFENSTLVFEGSSADANEARFTVTNPTGDRTFTFPDATGDVAVLNSTGFAVRTGAAAWAARSIDVTANELSITNGNGVSGNPTIDIPWATATSTVVTIPSHTLSVTGTTIVNGGIANTTSGTIVISGTAGNAVTLLASGTSVDTNLHIRAKGSGQVFFYNTLFHSSSFNYFLGTQEFTGANTFQGTQNAANTWTTVDNGIRFEGPTADAFEGTLLAPDVTADVNWTLPIAGGTLVGTNSGTAEIVTSSTLAGLQATGTAANIQMTIGAKGAANLVMNGYSGATMTLGQFGLTFSNGMTVSTPGGGGFSGNHISVLSGTSGGGLRLVNPDQATYINFINAENVSSPRWVSWSVGNANRAMVLANSGTIAVLGGTNTWTAPQTFSTAVIHRWTGTTASFTAEVGMKYMVNTTSGVFTGTLPASPTDGDEIEFMDPMGTWDTNNFTIHRNGNLINSGTANIVCNVEGDAVRVVYVASGNNWVILP